MRGANAVVRLQFNQRSAASNVGVLALTFNVLLGCTGTISTQSPCPSLGTCDPATPIPDAGPTEEDAGVIVDTPVIVATPLALTATVAGEHKVSLRWSMPSTSTGTETFSVHRLNVETGVDVQVTENLGTKEYTDDSVTKGSTYSYVVVAHEGLAKSQPSAPSIITITNASMLFHTKFGAGVALNPATNISDSQAWQQFSGTDAETGYSFPVAALGSSSTALQLIGPYGKGGTALSSSNLDAFFRNSLQVVSGPLGRPVNELFFSVQKKEEPVGDARTQVPVMISRSSKIGDTGDIYISYWFKFPENLADLLDETVPAGHWRVMFEWKTGGFNNTYAGDYRMKTQVIKTSTGELRWHNAWDNEANITDTDVPGWKFRTYWSEVNAQVKVPVGEWFKFEIFWHRSSGPDGRYWVAVNGTTIADHRGANMGDYMLPINRIMLSNAYSGGRGPVEGHMTDVQIWNGFPCGDGISCP